MDKIEAKKLFKKLQHNLLNAEKVLIEIINNKAWEPLGYSSFVDAYNSELKGCQLTKVMRAHVIYAFFSEGSTKHEVIRLTHTPDQKVDNIKAQFDAGTPVDVVNEDIYVRAHYRKPSAEPYRLVLEFDANMMAIYKYEAKKRGIDLVEYAQNLLTKEFDGMIAYLIGGKRAV